MTDKLPIEREVLRAGELGQLLGTSKAIVYKLNGAELIPAPIHLGGMMKWRRAEVVDWLAAGAPERAYWQWKPTMPQKLDDLLKDLHGQIREANDELRKVKYELGRNEALLNEADAFPG